MSDAPMLPPRDPSGHKGTFGTVSVVGGGANRETGITMLGGPVLSALASLRAGAGLVRLAVPEPLLAAALAEALPLTGVALPTDESGDLIAHECAARLDELASQSGAVVIGPGLGVSAGAAAAVLRLVGGGQESTPIVLDADALNNLAQLEDYPRELRAPCVLTPHVGEFGRLAAPLGVALTGETIAALEQAAQELAQRLGAVVVLKSSATVVTDGLRTWTLDAPNPALATAGSGDVLAGVIGSFIAQHHRAPILAGSRTIPSEGLGGISLFDAARAGVCAHSIAGQAWADEHDGADGGLLATDLLGYLPDSVAKLRESGRR